jgi:hypothetical protein
LKVYDFPVRHSWIRTVTKYHKEVVYFSIFRRLDLYHIPQITRCLVCYQLLNNELRPWTYWLWFGAVQMSTNLIKDLEHCYGIACITSTDYPNLESPHWSFDNLGRKNAKLQCQWHLGYFPFVSLPLAQLQNWRLWRATVIMMKYAGLFVLVFYSEKHSIFLKNSKKIKSTFRTEILQLRKIHCWVFGIVTDN